MPLSCGSEVWSLLQLAHATTYTSTQASWAPPVGDIWPRKPADFTEGNVSAAAYGVVELRRGFLLVKTTVT